ncbi:MAG TPA: P-loop NTPase [Anaeromyxobacteraceae bacterium]
MADAPTLKLVTPSPASPPRRRTPLPRKPTRARRVVSVGGGKGGIGKSLVAANLGIELARAGRRVVLVDADLGGANLHTCLGMEQPRKSLSDFVEKRIARIEDVVVPTQVPNLGLIAGALDHLDAANPKYAQKMRLLRHLLALDVDYAILDLGAGTHLNVLDFFLVSDHGVLVLVPEPTAIENVYRFVKAAFWRRVRNVVAVYGFEEPLRSVMGDGTFRSPIQVLRGLSEVHPEAARTLEREVQAFRPRLVVNQARTPQDAELGHAVVGAWKKYFGLGMDYLGHIEYDDSMWRTVRARRPLLLERPDSPAAQSFARIAARLVELDGGELEDGR